MLQKLKHFVFPGNPVDSRIVGRIKRGAIHYAHTGGWSAIPPMQRWLKNHSFTFQHGENGSRRSVKVSGGDLTHLWVADEVLVEHVYALEAVPFTPELVLDLGANIGLFTLLASTRWPEAKFVCVEPHPTTFGYLCDNLSANGVRATRLQCAVEAQPRLMYLQNEGAVYQALSDQPTTTATLTLPLDSLLPPVERLLIKMDIEGAEERTLNNLSHRLPMDTFIFIELHRGDASLAWMREWAGKNGFAFSQVRRRDDAIDGYLTRVEGYGAK